MKKQLITLLMAGLLVVGFGGSALAVELTKDELSKGVSVTQVLPELWTITIPATIDAGDDITITPTKMDLPVAATVTVKVDKAEVELTRKGVTNPGAGDKLNVKLQKDGLDITTTNPIATFEEDANPTTDIVTLKSVRADKGTLKAGKYEGGTVTFIAEYTNTANN